MRGAGCQAPLALLVALLLGGAPARADAQAGALPPTDNAALFDRASERFGEATRLLKTDPGAARATFTESVACFQAIVDSGVRNGPLLYNIGNAHLLSGDVGRAIVNYKRALRFTPGDTNLVGNLAAARARTQDRIPVGAARRTLETLLFWHYDLPAQTRWWVFVMVFDAAWLIALLRLLLGPGRIPRWPIGALGAGALLLGGSLAADAAGWGRRQEGVIVAPEAVGRKGPDATGYEPSFTAPLHAGVEFEAAEKRAGWVLARLSDGRETWLPEAAVEMVDGDGG